jgi:hypothetical protein
LTLEEEVVQLRDRVARLERMIGCKPEVSDSDRKVLAALLPAIAAKRGSEVFRVSELLQIPMMRHLTSLSTQKLGMLLARSVGTEPIKGFIVERTKIEHGSLLWRVVRVDKVDSRPLHKIAVTKSVLP